MTLVLAVQREKYFLEYLMKNIDAPGAIKSISYSLGLRINEKLHKSKADILGRITEGGNY